MKAELKEVLKKHNTHVVEYKEDSRGRRNYLCKRESRGDYIVWTSHPPHDTFINGFYSTNLMDTVEEYKRRVLREYHYIEAEYVLYKGFDKPIIMKGMTLNEFLDEVIIDSNYLGNLNNRVQDEIEEVLELHGFDRPYNEDDFIEDLKEILYLYGVFVNPSIEELQEYNLEKGLLPNENLV